MKAILDISFFTFKEGLRHRILYGILTFACVLIVLSVLLSGMFMRDISKVLLDFCLSAVSLGGLLVPIFIAINLLAGDIETRNVYTILSLPVSRTSYIIGKFLGLCILLASIMVLLTIATLISIQAGIFLYSDAYFTEISTSSIISSVVIAALGNMVLLGCVFFWSSITTSSFLTTLLTLATYLIGQTIEEIVRFMSVQTPGVEFSPLFKKSVIFFLYIFPNLSAFDLKQQAAHGQLISLNHMAFLTSYGFAYLTVVLGFAIIFFSRRDLP